MNPAIGEYYAALLVPGSAVPGNYRIRWTFVEVNGGAVQTVVQDFTVIDPDIRVVSYTPSQQSMIDKLRLLLRDQNPDKFYHFRPPEHEGDIGNFNRVAENLDLGTLTIGGVDSEPQSNEDRRQVRCGCW